LDSVEEEQSVLVGDVLEVDEVNNGPDLPRSLAGREEIGLNLCSNYAERVTVAKSKVGEENGHENWAPQGLVNKDFLRDRGSVLSGDLVVKPVVEVVTGRSVVEQTECGKSNESLQVKGTSGNENLCQQITKCPSNKRSACLGSQRFIVQSLVVGSPSRDSTSTNEGGVTEEGASDGRILAEGRLYNVIGQSARQDALGDSGVGRDTEGTSACRDEKETEELHDDLI